MTICYKRETELIELACECVVGYVPMIDQCTYLGMVFADYFIGVSDEHPEQLQRTVTRGRGYANVRLSASVKQCVAAEYHGCTAEPLEQGLILWEFDFFMFGFVSSFPLHTP